LYCPEGPYSGGCGSEYLADIQPQGDVLLTEIKVEIKDDEAYIISVAREAIRARKNE
jgi:hypothetical protein